MKKFILGFAVGMMVTGGAALVMAQSTKTFPDVASNAFYASAVDSMANLGVVNGYSNGNFGPNDPVTRAQVATMMNRYDQTLKLLIQDYCTNHKLQVGQMASLDYQNLCINRGYPAYTFATQEQ